MPPEEIQNTQGNSIALKLAERAFEAYNRQAGGKTWDGKDIPPFSEIGEKVTANWVAAVKELFPLSTAPDVVTTFSEALIYLKNGACMTREGWNGKGMYIEMQSPDENSKMQLPYLYMSTAQGELVPWLASQTDMLCEDWHRYVKPVDEDNSSE